VRERDVPQQGRLHGGPRWDGFSSLLERVDKIMAAFGRWAITSSRRGTGRDRHQSLAHPTESLIRSSEFGPKPNYERVVSDGSD
jgi:hypothetical protein